MRGLSRNSGAAAIFAIFAILAVHYWTVTAVSSQSIEFAGDFPPIETECRGTIAECSVSAALGEEEDLFYGGGMGAEFEMDSEINRRMLANRRYISYGALKRNTVPCSRRGASYYNCRNGAHANPYSRGCSVITRCRR